MSPNLRSWIKPTINIAAAGLGVAVAGPLGGVIGGWLGGAFSGPSAELVARYSEKFGEKAAEKLLDTGTDSLLDGMKTAPPNLESVYREALRLSLASIHSHPNDTPDIDDWFANWELCLGSGLSLRLDSIQPERLVPESLDTLFRGTLERLDAQGAALRKDPPTLLLTERPLPAALLATLEDQLPGALNENFRTLLVQEKYEEAWKQAQLLFEDFNRDTQKRIDQKTDLLPQMAEDIAATRRMAETFYAQNKLEGRVSDQPPTAKEEDIARLQEQVRALTEQLAARSAEPVEAKIASAFAAGNLPEMIRLKQEQIQTRRDEAKKIPSDLFELGKFYELRFDWAKALEAHREAWQLEQNPDYGFHYATCAWHQNRFDEAISIFLTVRDLYTDPADVARTLNNLALVYRVTHRPNDAGSTYLKALTIFRDLEKTDQDTYLPSVATTLNNVGIAYIDIHKMDKAEAAHDEAFAIRTWLVERDRATYLPDLAATLDNLGGLYRVTERFKLAEDTYLKCLALREELTQKNSDLYQPGYASTLSNLGVVYYELGRFDDAEEAQLRALGIRRKLAKVNPEVYQPDVAASLNNLGALYAGVNRVDDAERDYLEARSINEDLAQKSPKAYLPDLAATLNNLGNLYVEMKNTGAEEALVKAHNIRDQLAKQNAALYLPDLAVSKASLANFYRACGSFEMAEKFYLDASGMQRTLNQAFPGAYRAELAGTLNNLALLYGSRDSTTEQARAASKEAQELIEPLWSANPEVYDDRMARILWVRAQMLCRPPLALTEADALARRAITLTPDASLRKAIQEMIDWIARNPAFAVKDAPSDAPASA